MTLDEVFTELSMGSTVTLKLPINDFNTLRTGLLRKFAKVRQDTRALGFDPYEGLYVQATYLNGEATYLLTSVENKRRRQKNYGPL